MHMAPKHDPLPPFTSSLLHLEPTPKGRSHTLLRKRPSHLLRCSHRNSRHPRRPLGLGLRGAAGSIAPPTRPIDRRKASKTSEVPAGRRFPRLAATTADSSSGSSGPEEEEEEEKEKEGKEDDGPVSDSPPPPPLSSAAAAPAEGLARSDREVGSSRAASVNASGSKAGRAAATGVVMATGGGGAAAAEVVGVEDKGRRTSKGKMRDEGERTHAAGPPAWAPRWAVDMHPGWQAIASVGLYFLHMVGFRWACVGVGMGCFSLTSREGVGGSCSDCCARCWWPSSKLVRTM